jgi:hypothetical protein
LTPKAAHAANGGHGINTALAVPGKVALIVAVADVHIGYINAPAGAGPRPMNTWAVIGKFESDKYPTSNDQS